MTRSFRPPELGMGMARMCVGDTGLRGSIGLRPGVETPHPSDLMGTDAFWPAAGFMDTELRCFQ